MEYSGTSGTNETNETNGTNGVINVLKPPGMTSHEVVGYLRRAMSIKKAGHTGTLDPGAAGVLPVCLGQATRIIEYLADELKEYRAEATFGRSTDTQDGFGRTIRVSDASGLAETRTVETLLSFQGWSSQIPPMVSALKYKGRRLYEIAREGGEVDRKPRPVQIYQIEIIRCSGFGTAQPRVLFNLKCSKGTYVRTICHDLGERLGCGGFLSFLVRTGTGRFHISEALTLEEICALIDQGRIREAVLPLGQALPFEPVWVDDSVVQYVGHGNRIFSPAVQAVPDRLAENQLVKLMNCRSGCLAVARVIYETGSSLNGSRRYAFQPVKVFASGEI